MFVWIDLIVNVLLPLYTCENDRFCTHVRYDSISYKTLRVYVKGLTEVVERKTSALLPEKFAIVFDGWTVRDSHYVSIYATLPFQNDDGFRKILLAFSPFSDETSKVQSSTESMLSTFWTHFRSLSIT